MTWDDIMADRVAWGERERMTSWVLQVGDRGPIGVYLDRYDFENERGVIVQYRPLVSLDGKREAPVVVTARVDCSDAVWLNDAGQWP